MVDSLNKQHKMLSVDEIGRMGKYISHMQRVHLGGGEPMTRTDISELALCIADSWDTEILCIPTNGWFKDYIVHFIHSLGTATKKTVRIHFSINTLGDIMDEFAGVDGAFEQWKKSITAALETSKQYPNITIVGLITYGEYNQHQFGELKDFLLKEIGVDDLSVQLVREHEHFKTELNIPRFEKLIKAYFQDESKQSPLLRAYRSLVREYSAHYFRSKRKIVTCYAGITRAVLSPEGDVYPCEHLGYPSGNKKNEWLLGNIRDYDYNMKKVLKSPKAKKVLQRIDSDNCHCEHGIDLSLNLLNSKKFLVKLLLRTIQNTLFNTQKEAA